MFLFFVDSVHFQWWRSFYVFLVSLAEKRLMDVKLNELGAWLGGRDFTPNGILSAIRRGEYILLRLLLVGRKNVFLFFFLSTGTWFLNTDWLFIYIFFQLALSSSPLLCTVGCFRSLTPTYLNPSTLTTSAYCIFMVSPVTHLLCEECYLWGLSSAFG